VVCPLSHCEGLPVAAVFVEFCIEVFGNAGVL